MTTAPRWTKTTLLFGGVAVWGLILIGCVAVNRTVLAPPAVAGAQYVGSKACAECHSDQTDHFGSASHARVALAADPKLGSTGCEACHGPGSLHVKAGGSRSTIVNPGKSPEACFACHLDKRGSFSLPNSHQVLNGHMSCADCHEPHSGNAIKGSGASLEAETETCTKCHTAQKGPFIFKHNAMKEGCTACHSPHGSVNAKMLVARDANLCLRCHLEIPQNPASQGNVLFAGTASAEDHRTRLQNGTCWSAGCHEAIHGSNSSKPLRY